MVVDITRTLIVISSIVSSYCFDSCIQYFSWHTENKSFIIFIMNYHHLVLQLECKMVDPKHFLLYKHGETMVSYRPFIYKQWYTFDITSDGRGGHPLTAYLSK